jgi:membrane fusion protein (multidrug efflux system)
MNTPELLQDQNTAKDPQGVGGSPVPRDPLKREAGLKPGDEVTGSAPPAATAPISGGGGERPVASPAGTRRRMVVIIIAALMVIGALALGFFPRWRQRQTAEANMNELAITTVSVVSPAFGTPGNGLILPAEIRPWREASIYARVNGYLKDWLVDIGAHVQQNQELAEIETPDLDQQLDQARAQLQLAQANLHLAEITDTRWQELLKTAAVTQQDADTKTAGRETATASVAADEANMRRLEQLVSYEKIIAPFSGIITLREVDIGDLIIAGNGGREMFHMAQTDKLRVYVRVPEPDALGIAAGQTADLHIPESPGQTFTAIVITTSEAISTTSRTLLVELEVDNSKNQILPYSYGDLTFKANHTKPLLTVPSDTLLFRAQGLQVGVVLPNDTVELRSIQEGRDFGQTVEIISGVTPADRVIINPSDSLISGIQVRIADASGAADKK